MYEAEKGNIVEEGRMEKHADIHDSIKRLNNIVSRLSGLKSKISGEVPPPEVEGCVKECHPPLAVFLRHSGEEIHGIYNHCDVLITEIEELLF